MTVVDAHKGPVRWRVELTGRAAHSSMPHLGVNAIAYAGSADRRACAHGSGAESGRARRALRSALDHASGDADRGRHRLQHRAGAVLVRLGDPRATRLRSDVARRAAEAPRRGDMPARDAPRRARGRHPHRHHQPGAGLRRRYHLGDRPARPAARAGRTRRSPSPTARKPACSRTAAPRPSSSAPATSPRRTRPTSSSPFPSWTSACGSSSAWRTGPRHDACPASPAHRSGLMRSPGISS